VTPRFGLCFGGDTVFSLIPSHLPLSLRSPRIIIAIGASATAAVGLAVYALTRKRPTAEELERNRRDLLATTGRITDGTILDTSPENHTTITQTTPEGELDTTPRLIVYNYRIAGVTYECCQDVTTLADYVRGIRPDLPIQVRYAPQNPGNSIVVAESWSGLRLSSSHPYPPTQQTETT